MTRQDFLEYCLNTYGTSADYPFENDLETAVLRHESNRKWYALVMKVSRRKFGIDSDEVIDVVNLKLPLEMFGSFGKADGVYPAYHMNKLHWISVLLPDAPNDVVEFLTNASFEATRSVGKNMKINLATKQDIDNWMDLVGKVKDNFPGLETDGALDEHRNTVLEFMDKASAICAKADNKIVGTLLFSNETNTLCFLAVDMEYRRQHIAEKMFDYMLTFMDAKKDIIVTTYRANVPEGIPARRFYKKMGFAEGKLTEEFGSPVQEFALKR